ncbi:hypothetical protein K438DRAFT_1781033 [Mycena galopus ATCC 62051]|nr:hypothetical protein K438DRAFT_1781033 [Mycena galopus ATCC 62051]
MGIPQEATYPACVAHTFELDLGDVGFNIEQGVYGDDSGTNINNLSGSLAGRIWWIQRAASHVALDNTICGRYHRATVIILESGAVYCLLAIFQIINYSLSPNGLAFSIGIGITQQLSNIIPTFTLVYIGLKNMSDNSSAHLENNIIVLSKLANGHLPSRSRAHTVLHRCSSWPVLDIKMEGPGEDLQDV